MAAPSAAPLPSEAVAEGVVRRRPFQRAEPVLVVLLPRVLLLWASLRRHLAQDSAPCASPPLRLEAWFAARLLQSTSTSSPTAVAAAFDLPAERPAADALREGLMTPLSFGSREMEMRQSQQGFVQTASSTGLKRVGGGTAMAGGAAPRVQQMPTKGVVGGVAIVIDGSME